MIEVLPTHKKYRISELKNRSASSQYYCYSKWLCGSWSTRRDKW